MKTWRKRLGGAIENRRELKARDKKIHQEMSLAAGKWLSCAIGENRKKLEKKGYKFYGKDRGINFCYDGEPLDETLFDLGLEFNDLIDDANYEGALGVLDEIEAIAKGELK